MNTAPHPSWSDDDLVLVSALEHWHYCPRQCLLIHSERTFDENLYTLRGRLLHQKVDRPTGETREGVRVECALPIWSDRLGMVGKADAVEFHGDTPYPVEFKLGRRHVREAASIQLCAQGICLEEMTGQSVLRGALFHHGSRRRREVEFTAALRGQVEQCVAAVRKALGEARLPPPVRDARCRLCSLKEACMPGTVAAAGRVRAVMERLFCCEE
jgi:CRISPR-associated exonuclease Cas4